MANVDLNTLIRDPVRALQPYQVENFDCEIKLHANENAFPPPASLLEGFEKRLRDLALNRYPDPDCTRLKQAIARRLNVTPDRLMVGNGSDELIQILLQIFCGPGDAVAFPDPTFAMYAIIARGMGLQTVPCPLDDNWDFQAESFLESIAPHRPKIVFFSYPNNPTGNCFDAGALQRVLETFQGIVVLDEAYYDFARKSFLAQAEHHNNLVILRSLSKIGLAALRVGFGVADPLIIREVNKIRLPYNSNSVSQAFSELLLNRFEPVQRQIDWIVEERNRLMTALAQIPGITVFPSDANFLLFRLDTGSKEVFQNLVDRGILIRDLGGHPRLKNCLRVTIGTEEENRRFLESLKAVNAGA